MKYLNHFSTVMTVCLRKTISKESSIKNTSAFKRSNWGKSHTSF